LSVEPIVNHRPSMHAANCTCLRCTGWPKGNELALRHGAGSERHVRPLAHNHRRRLLRSLGLKAGEVDAVGRAYLTHYCRDLAKLELLDAYIAEHGLLLPDGRPQPCMSLYTRLSSSATRALGKLEQHLRQTGHDPLADISDYLAGRA
jgi:hypothetical protein